MDNKKFVRGMSALAVAGAGAVALHLFTTRNEKGRALRRAAENLRDHVAARVARIGKVTRRSYGKIVDAAIDEYRAMKTLSERELEDLSAELKADWQGIRSVFKNAEDDMIDLEADDKK